MEIIRISPTETELAAIKAAADCIRAGGVVAFPSDTSYGLAADPRNPAAMEKLYRIKGRSPEKSVSCIFRSLEMIGEWARVSTDIEAILKSHLPGAFTFLLVATESYPLEGLVGARIPDHPVTQALAEALGRPYTATSANRSGEPACFSIEDMLAQLKTGELPDIALDAGLLPAVPSSTVVDLSVSPPAIVRQGSGIFNNGY